MENTRPVRVSGVKRSRPPHCVDVPRTKAPRFSAPATKTVIRGYQSFMRSMRPRRVMFFQGGEWCDFPKDAMVHLVDAFEIRRPAVEISMVDSNYLIDFVHMVMIDLETETQQSIAWIDDADKCFFPMLCFESDRNFDKICDDNEIMLKLQIMIGGSADHAELAGRKIIRDKIEEEEANSVVKNVIVHNEAVSCHDIRFNGLFEKLIQLKRGDKEYKKLERCFVNGLGTNISPNSLMSIHRYIPKDGVACARFQLFEEQLRSMQMQRGDANVRFGWFGTSKEGVMQLFHSGIGRCWKPFMGMASGSGIFLASENCSYISAKYCDVDENDMQHMVLCRIIMGNMEHVKPGCKQFHPSSENFDSGVDDIRNPRLYMIWSSSMSTHIYPEYVLSFKLTAPEQEHFAGFNDIEEIVGVAKADDRQATNIDSLSRKITREHFIQKVRELVGDELLRKILKPFLSDKGTGFAACT